MECDLATHSCSGSGSFKLARIKLAPRSAGTGALHGSRYRGRAGRQRRRGGGSSSGRSGRLLLLLRDDAHVGPRKSLDYGLGHDVGQLLGADASNGVR
jgi:hypothetical protein